jgi:hypothetical protein
MGIRLPYAMTPRDYKTFAERELNCTIRIVQVVERGRYKKRMRKEAFNAFDLACMRARMCRNLGDK